MDDQSKHMKIDFELTLDDLVAFNVVHGLRSPTFQRKGFGCFVGVMLLSSVLPGLILATTEKPVLETARDIWPLLMAPAFCLLIPLWWKLLIPLSRKRFGAISKRMLEEGRNSGAYGPCSLTIESGGLRETRPAGESLRRWSAVEKVLVTDTHAFVYTSAVEAFVLPRRAFESSDGFQQFVDALSERAGVSPETI